MESKFTEQYNKILDMQKKYNGANNFCSEEPSYFLNQPIFDCHTQFIETRSHIFGSDTNSIKTGFKISTSEDYNNGYAYHNLRIITDLNYIEKIELHAGGSIIDQSYPSLLKNYTPFSILQEHVLPTLQNHSYEIYVHCDRPTEITYDVVKIRNLTDRKFEKVYKSISYSGPDTIDPQSTSYKFKLSFDNPIIYLKAFLPVSAKNVFLIIDKNNDNKLEFSKEINQDKYSCWNLNLGSRGINFSRIIVVLNFETEFNQDILNNQDMHIFGHNLKVFRGINEIC